jgi:hypothetical protein
VPQASLIRSREALVLVLQRLLALLIWLIDNLTLFITFTLYGSEEAVDAFMRVDAQMTMVLRYAIVMVDTILCGALHP